MSLLRGRSTRAILASTFSNALHAPRFIAGFVARRDRNTWVFGNVHGFRDSPRYLAQYVRQDQPGIRVVWLAHDDQSASAAESAGLEVVLARTRAARRVQLRAGVAFFTHGFRDLDLSDVAGAYQVYLWHGTPLKRVGLDVSRVQARRRSAPARLAARIVRLTQASGYRLVRLFVAAGELDRQRFITAFGAPPKRVVALGSPRFDVIRGGRAFDLVVQTDLRAQLGYGPDDRLIVWLPTHRREYGEASWLPALDGAQLDEALGPDSRIKLLIKPHPNAEWDVFRERMSDDPRIRLMRESDVDVNALLHVADGLITDYSSVCFDYAILERPIWFLAPDVERYNSDRGLYDPYDVVTGGRHHLDWGSLLAAMRADESDAQGGEGMANWKSVADYARNNTEPDACGRIVDVILAATTH